MSLLFTQCNTFCWSYYLSDSLSINYCLWTLLNPKQNLLCSWTISSNRPKIHFAQLFVWTQIYSDKQIWKEKKKKDANIVLKYLSECLSNLCKYFLHFFPRLILSHSRSTSRNTCKLFPEFLYARNVNRMAQCTVVFFCWEMLLMPLRKVC